MKKEERLQVYQMYDGHCAYCGKPIKYEDMQVDHFIAKNRGCYCRLDSKEGKYIITHGKDSIENYMPSCRACNFKKKDMSLEQFRDAIRYQAKGLLRGATKFQVSMSIAYGLLMPAFDAPIEFYFDKFKNKENERA